MPRLATITQDHVNAIANRLKSTGTKPTVRLIIAEHGSGSPGTVHPMLKNWESGQPQQATGITLSPVLMRVLQEHFGQEVARATAEVQSQLANSEETAADLARENKQLAEQLEEHEDNIGQLMDANAALQGRIDQLERDLASAREEALTQRAGAERAHTELAKLEMRLEAMPRLEADLASAKAESESERRARTAAEQTAAVSTAQREHLAERVTDNKLRIESLETQLTTSQERERRQVAELTSTRVAIEAGNARLEQAERTISSLRENLAASRSSERQAIETTAELRGKIAA
ncbi:DNA-binding protein [Janthinobacterium lividum]|uniref:DNA-binding protein n=1 Tax=Janthinobacterium lividum TaxID=29581 RepID=UPI001595AE14|nr:DNA-binding protein [Janthinobacterium lividum]QKY12009.1 mucin-associated surface protein [Janthinobacterium lividum]